MKPATAITVLVGLLFAASRVWIGFTIKPPKEPINFFGLDAYKDYAHIFWGYVFGLACIQRKPWQWILAVSLVVIEVAMAWGSRNLW